MTKDIANLGAGHG